MDKRGGRTAGCDYGCRVFSRLAPAALVLALVTGVVTGCFAQPEPEPEPGPTSLFTSEDEAFAAAEETYRQYVDALNQVDLSDPETFEDVYAWTTGEANAGARESFSQMHADGWVVAGPTAIQLMEPHSGDSSNVIHLATCLDVSGVTLVDADGESVVAPDRRDVQAMAVVLTSVPDSPTGLLISDIDGREGAPECSA